MNSSGVVALCICRCSSNSRHLAAVWRRCGPCRHRFPRARASTLYRPMYGQCKTVSQRPGGLVSMVQRGCPECQVGRRKAPPATRASATWHFAQCHLALRRVPLGSDASATVAQPRAPLGSNASATWHFACPLWPSRKTPVEGDSRSLRLSDLPVQGNPNPRTGDCPPQVPNTLEGPVP